MAPFENGFEEIEDDAFDVRVIEGNDSAVSQQRSNPSNSNSTTVRSVTGNASNAATLDLTKSPKLSSIDLTRGNSREGNLPASNNHRNQIQPNSATPRVNSSVSQAGTPNSHVPHNGGFTRYSGLPATGSTSGSPFGTLSGPSSSQTPVKKFVPHFPHRPTVSIPSASHSIPVISSAASARTPSHQLQSSAQSAKSPNSPALTPNGQNYYKMQSASVNAAVQAARPVQGGFIPASQVPTPTSSTAKGKSRQVIDLTSNTAPEEILIKSDSDESMIFDESPVCIGQLTSLALILYPIDELLPPKDVPEGTPLRPLPVHMWRAEKNGNNETMKLVSPGKQEVFGVMEHRIANVLAPLLGDNWSGTGILEDTKKILFAEAQIIRRWEQSPMMLPLQLLLFARPLDVAHISTTLERNAIYLEYPRGYNPAVHQNAKYSNPHNPPAEGGGREGERHRNQVFSGMYGKSGLGATRSIKTQEVARNQVEQVFKELDSGPDLPEVQPPPVVTTKLYPHQKQALAFLLDRERLKPIPAKDSDRSKPTIISLWARESDVFGRIRGWRNIVTDLELNGAEPPPQTRGSILADDMGLGKTLVIVSLVASTLQEATEWAKESITKENLDNRLDSMIGVNAKKASLAEFSTPIYGIPVQENAPTNSAATKKKNAAEKREKKRSEINSIRYNRLVTRSRASLIVCPLSTVQNWESQFEEHTGYKDGTARIGRNKLERIIESTRTHENSSASSSSTPPPISAPIRTRPRKRIREILDSSEESASEPEQEPDDDQLLKIYVYHGHTRISDPHKLADFDVVITTFSTLGTEYSKQQKAQDEREKEEELAQSRNQSEDEAVQVFGYAQNGEIFESKPGTPNANAGKPMKPKPQRKRKKIQGSGKSPLQQIQWFRVVLDEAHIIKEHTTIQARAACDLSATRRACLSGTPLQNSLNDLFSLIRFLRLEPFTVRAVWNQHIGALAKIGDPLGVDRLQLIMRNLALRRTKDSKDKDGKPILSLPAVSHKVVPLQFDAAESAFYSSHHLRYKHEFKKLEETDSINKNYCNILQELLRLRQICVHTSLVRDGEDSSNGGDLIKSIETHGISKNRAIQLLALMRDAGGGQCSECGVELLNTSNQLEAPDAEEDSGCKKSAKKAKKSIKTSSAQNSDVDSKVNSSSDSEMPSIITRCQHLFCPDCFNSKVYAGWPNRVKADEKAICSVCKLEIIPALDAVQISQTEFEQALERAADEVEDKKITNKSSSSTRLFEHSTKTRALVADLFPFSQANPASRNFFGGMSDEISTLSESTGGTIGFQPVKGQVVKSVVFSQWTKLLDRLGDALNQEKIRFTRLDGAMNRDHRTKAMDIFKADPGCEVLLVSLRAGGVGLNLTAARRVYLMEPFWNPAVENQAVDRVYRLGQTMSVQTVRFVISKSIEENMLKIQKRKMDLANMSLKQTLSKAELAKQRREELQILLS